MVKRKSIYTILRDPFTMDDSIGASGDSANEHDIIAIHNLVADIGAGDGPMEDGENDVQPLERVIGMVDLLVGNVQPAANLRQLLPNEADVPHEP